ncbi:GAF domain-containing protein, partial [Planctomycetota bacterium]
MAELVSNSGARFTIESGTQTMGRDPSGDIVVVGDGVSRNHARLETIGNATRVIDQKSTNGVFVNGTKVSDSWLRHGDTLRLGDAVLTFEAESPVDYAISAIKRLKSDPEAAATVVLPGTDLLDRTEILGPMVGLEARLDSLARELAKADETALTKKDIEALLLELDLLRESVSQTVKDMGKFRASQERMMVLLQVSGALNMILHVDDLLAAIMDMALAAVRAERGVVMLYDPPSDDLVPRIARSIRPDIDHGKDGGFSKSIALKVFKTGETYRSNDAPADSGGSETIVQSGIMSAICVPLKARGRTRGVLCVDTREKKAKFTEEDTALLEGIAAQAAIALENASLYDEIAEQKRSIELIINSMADAVLVADADYNITFMNSAAELMFNTASVRGADLKLRAILEDARQVSGNCTQDIVLMTPERTILESSVTYLTDSSGARTGLIMAMRNMTEDRERERTRAKFLSFVAHKLNDPLEGFRNEVRALVESGRLPEDETTNRLRSQVEFFRELAIKLLYFAELASGPLRLRRARRDLVELARKAADDMKSFCDEKNLTVVAPTDPSPVEAYVDEERLFQAITNLLLNAIAASPPEGEIGYTVSDDGTCSRICVWDAGDESERPADSMFDEKDLFIEDIIQTKTMDAGRSSIRMAFIYHIMNAHGGTV